ncbi:MAG: hypothetical protein NTW03_03185, partial [Verrucomicrobia bacterium]|nr:hypothetical protein [Verrucomicrobiota bacterium]
MSPKSLLPSQKAPQEESRINWVKVAPPKKSLKSLGRMLKISDRLNKAGRIGIHGAVGFSIAAFLVGQPEYLSQRL